MSPEPPRDRRVSGIAAAAVLTLLQGCQPVMSTQPNDPPSSAQGRADNTVADWPFKFRRHNFGAACYSTYGCKVVYDDFLHIDEPDDVLEPSSASIGPEYLDYLKGGYLGIRNFPPPAQVRWRSRDGNPHQAAIDMGAIFRDQLILHKVPKEDIPEGISITDPAIILEVNDRTINVYMRAFIPTKELQIPENQYSGARTDLILAFTETY